LLLSGGGGGGGGGGASGASGKGSLLGVLFLGGKASTTNAVFVKKTKKNYYNHSLSLTKIKILFVFLLFTLTTTILHCTSSIFFTNE